MKVFGDRGQGSIKKKFVGLKGFSVQPIWDCLAGVIKLLQHRFVHLLSLMWKGFLGLKLKLAQCGCSAAALISPDPARLLSNSPVWISEGKPVVPVGAI